MKKILFVPGLAGEDLNYVLPKITAHADVIAYMARSLTSARVKAIEQFSKTVIQGDHYDKLGVSEQDIADDIASKAKQYKVDAILTIDEFYVTPVSIAANKLGLNGAGLNASISRNKYKMRAQFEKFNVPSVKFQHVRNLDDMYLACEKLSFPFLLKLVEGAGSMDQVIITSKNQAETEYLKIYEMIKEMGGNKNLSVVDTFTTPEFVAEDIIKSSARDWFHSDKYGDYLSIEGIVIKGQYYPICVVTRLPIIKPYVESGVQAPADLPVELQIKLADTAKCAVDSIGLEYCGTHTEIKLMPNREVCLIETAARFGGWSIVRMVEDSFGVNMIGGFTEALLTGERPNTIPLKLLSGEFKKATGVVTLIPATREGMPWARPAYFRKDIDWQVLLGKDIAYAVSWSSHLKEGDPIHKYDPSLGCFNSFGSIFLSCDTPQQLVSASHKITDNLEQLFCSALE